MKNFVKMKGKATRCFSWTGTRSTFWEIKFWRETEDFLERISFPLNAFKPLPGFQGNLKSSLHSLSSTFYLCLCNGFAYSVFRSGARKKVVVFSRLFSSKFNISDLICQSSSCLLCLKTPLALFISSSNLCLDGNHKQCNEMLSRSITV